MTDSPPNSPPVGTQITAPSFIQIPIELAQYVRTLKLTGTQYDLWLYLFGLDPYGDRFVEVPPPQEIATLLQVDYRTIQRAAQRLEDCHLFEFQIERWKARNRKAFRKTVLPDEHFASKPAQGKDSTSFPHFSLGKEIQNLQNGSKLHQTDPNCENGISLPRENKTLQMKPAQGKGSENGSVPIVLNKCSETTEQPPTYPVDGINREEIGTSELIERVQNAGIYPNKTIQRTIVELHRQDPAAAAQSVENALSAVTEQVSRGGVKNPGGLLIAALRQGYTSNQAKQQVKERKARRAQPPPDLHTVEFAIDQAMLQGDHPFAFGKLQQLWAEGWHDQVRELCHLRHEWGFSVTAEGVRDEN